MYDVYEIRKDFPILSELINGKPNTFLDTAASAQKPRQVIEKMNEVYFGQYANVHRGSYYLSEQATAEYEMRAALLRISSMPLRRRKLFLPATPPSRLIWLPPAGDAKT